MPARRATAGRWWRRAAVVGIAAVLAAGGVTWPAAAHGRGHHPGSGEPVRVVAEGLNGPRQLSAWHGSLLVAESDTGRIVRVDPRTGRTRAVVEGLATPQGVVGARGAIFVATGEASPDAEPGEGPAAGIMVARPGGTPRMFADLTAYELANNPDGQTQFDANGQPLDALSNPYFLLQDRRRHGFLLVADAGANAVLAVDARGRVSTFFVPPTVTTGACAQVPNNNASGVGCDAVPTGLAYGPDGLLYVSALTSEVPGEGRVWVVDRRGRIVRSLTGFSGPTGVAVDRWGTVYVSELLEGAPAGDGPPPPDFDPSAVGQIVRVTRGGSRTYAQVTMPSGLLIEKGRLWASAWSIASFLGLQDAGQVVTVSSSAFAAADD